MSFVLGETAFFLVAGANFEAGFLNASGFLGRGFWGFIGAVVLLSAACFLGASSLFEGASFLDVSFLDSAFLVTPTFLDVLFFLDVSSFFFLCILDGPPPLCVWTAFLAATFSERMPFATPLTGVAWPAAPAPCETTTQFPKPAVVVNEARQRFLEVPPVHLVPAGILTLSSCVPTAAGF